MTAGPSSRQSRFVLSPAANVLRLTPLDHSRPPASCSSQDCAIPPFCAQSTAGRSSGWFRFYGTLRWSSGCLCYKIFFLLRLPYLPCPEIMMPCFSKTELRKSTKNSGQALAEREGFEPSISLLSLYSLSRGAPSTTRPSLRLLFHIPLEIVSQKSKAGA